MGDATGVGDERSRRELTARELALLDYLGETLTLVDESGELVARVGPVMGALGFEHGDEGAPSHVAERVHPDDLLLVLELIERVRRTPGLTESLRVRARHKDGRWRMLEATVQEVSHDLRLGGAVVRIRDITNLLGDERDSDARFRSLADAVPSGILTADSQGWVVFSNEAARQILDLPAANLAGRGWETVVHAEDLADAVTAANAVLGSSPGEQVSFRVQTRSGERWVHARFLPLRPDRDRFGPDGSAGGGGADESPDEATRKKRMGWIVALEDITDRRRTESQLAHRATHDPLTGLPNRALLEDRLLQACARLSRGGEQAAVLFCDLDGFKEINDRYDHTVGDQVLVEVARRLRRVLRPADTVARLGGDEFVVVCERTGAEEAAEVAGRIHEVLAVPFMVSGGSAELGVSVGIACTSDPNTDPAELLLRADQAMYRAKHPHAADEQGQATGT